MINIPIYRAKKIDSDEYVEGYYYKDGKDHIIFNGDSTTIFGLRVIDPTTLSIHFPDMLDSQGNKIFASLQEDGKGGDIISLENITKTAMWCSKTQAVMLNSKSTGLSILSLYKEDIKVIGIQE